MARYRVELYDNALSLHDRRYIFVAAFPTAAAANARAKELIRFELERLWRPAVTGAQLYDAWAAAGRGVRIVGPEPGIFNAYDYARLRTIGPRSFRLSDAIRAPEDRFLGW